MDTISPPDARPRLLRRCLHHRMVGGVAAGLADYLDVDVSIVRVVLVVFALVGGVAVPLYAAAWLLLPEEETGLSIAGELLARQDWH